jgi:prepilin-type N-terminal cleavage/methylation domain-containing protein
MSRLGAEDGMTLIEVLVAVSILGIAVVSIVSGLATASSASDRHRKQATADTVVKSFAETIKQKTAVGAYVRCTTTTPTPLSSYDDSSLPGGWTPPTGYSADVSKIEYWSNTAPAGFKAACPAGGDQGAQLLTLSARSNDGRDTESLQIVARKP